MNKFFISLILLSGAMLHAQEIPSSSSRTIEPIPSGTNTSGSMLFPNSTEEKKYVRPSETPTIDLTQKTDLLDPGVRFQGQKFKSDAPPVNFINDTYLGEIKTGKAVLNMTLWDPRLEDGDRVRIWLNDEILITDMTLLNAAQGFPINLKDGFNKIEIEALNQGYSAPNTSGIVIRDDEGDVMEEKVCMINAGVKSLLIVIKE
ncbi:hypothetical protein FNJ87_15555 [Nonlabens mediterrranea]|uniref:Uncharacterized protein n=1 Tax=Nonlabens mediterrranea TaxID=1419947 RepID=A0ABS0A8S3_9FLAO|nr:hypothetical protein [Nonlabens mediterrranea]